MEKHAALQEEYINEIESTVEDDASFVTEDTFIDEYGFIHPVSMSD